ncbi:MAG: hypothetical protein ACOYS2_02730 [Patescibacteria group bacterium]
MELKEIISIIKKDWKALFATIIVILAIIFSYFLFRPVSFDSSLDLNITRSGKQETPDYKYDNFYRLQADEKFADTLVEWLKSPSVVSRIMEKAGQKEELSLKQLSRAIEADKYSSQLVLVNYSSVSEKEAQKMAQAIESVLEENIEELNRSQAEENWFQIVAQGPTIKVETFDPFTVFIASLVLGIFFGFWVVFIRHYLN